MIHGNILWSNAYVNENATIDLIVNAMMLAKVVLHILQQELKKGTLNFETSDQAIRNISKHVDVPTNKAKMQKLKELKAKNRRMKANAKVAKNKLMKKSNTIVENSSSSNNEISLPPFGRRILFCVEGYT
jgi:hypothetical protein